jgi:hypothetical protein
MLYIPDLGRTQPFAAENAPKGAINRRVAAPIGRVWRAPLETQPTTGNLTSYNSLMVKFAEFPFHALW